MTRVPTDDVRNTRGTLNRALEELIEHPIGGRIVNTASYAASKAGILGLTRTMALDYGLDKIRVNTIVPGAIDMPLSWRNALEAGIAEGDIEASWAPIHALGHHGQPADVAHMVVFLCTDKARCITGSAFVVDGGLLARA